MSDTALAAALLAVDPVGLGGAMLRGRPGPHRDAWLSLHRDLLPDDPAPRRLPPRIGDDALQGGLDLTATLAAGRPVTRPGVLEATAGGTLVLPMAERATPALAARLLAGLRTHGFALLCLDEAEGDDEAPPPAFADRLAFRLTPDDAEGEFGPDDVARARQDLASVCLDAALIEQMLGIAASGGIASLRAPWLALRAACASAALNGRTVPTEDDMAAGVRLVLGPRATIMPPPPEDPDAPPPPEEQQDNPPPEEEQEPKPDPGEGAPQDTTTEAEDARLPPHLLAALALAAKLGNRPAPGRTGAGKISLKRGRPVGTAPGMPRDGARLALLETLRAAVPWQRLRPAPKRGLLAIRRQDFRIRRFREATESTAIFVLDASGSAALHRLGEAKGAVELLLADCYARRDRVAVIAFRGTGAETLLSPTQSLVRAKRALAGLPGGGASPLASGLEEGQRIARLERRAGRQPLLVLLTDGRTNLTRDGRRGRPEAEADALLVARSLAEEKLPLLVVDTGPRPQPFAGVLAQAAGGRSIALPAARAEALAAAVRQAA